MFASSTRFSPDDLLKLAILEGTLHLIWDQSATCYPKFQLVVVMSDE